MKGGKYEINHDNTECSICIGMVDGPCNYSIHTAGPKHWFHHECLKDWVKRPNGGNLPTCPMCRADITQAEVNELIRGRRPSPIVIDDTPPAARSPPRTPDGPPPAPSPQGRRPRQKRCPRGTRRGKATGECAQAQPLQRKNCPKGTRRNKTTRECEPRGEPRAQRRCPKHHRRNKATGACDHK